MNGKAQVREEKLVAASDWATSQLKEYFDNRLVEMDKRLIQSISDNAARVDLAMKAARDAVEKAEHANDRRLDLLNEFRAQQADEARKYALMAVVDQKFLAIQERLNRDEVALSNLQGRAVAFAGFGALFGGAIASLITRFFSH